MHQTGTFSDGNHGIQAVTQLLPIEEKQKSRIHYIRSYSQSILVFYLGQSGHNLVHACRLNANLILAQNVPSA